MKKIINKISCPVILLVTTVMLSSCGPTNQIQQPATTPENIAKAIDSGNWVFTPQQAMPQYGRTRTVTSDFSVTFRSNKLVIYLPYYGRATAGADVFSGKGPLDFTSVDFSVDKQQARPGEWNITIKPKDNGEMQSMSFTFFDNGTATLDVVMNARSGIRFSGFVAPGKQL